MCGVSIADMRYKQKDTLVLSLHITCSGADLNNHANMVFTSALLHDATFHLCFAGKYSGYAPCVCRQYCRRIAASPVETVPDTLTEGIPLVANSMYGVLTVVAPTYLTTPAMVRCWATDAHKVSCPQSHCHA